MLDAAGSCMTPNFDFHALAPEIILSATIIVVLIADLLFADRERWQTPRIATIGVLAALIPVITLAIDGTDRVMFGGAYVVDPYALTFKALFLVAAYVTLLLSVDYIGEGDYYQGEFYFLLLTSVLGMIVMASARDLITIFVALEAISIPTFVLAGWRKHDTEVERGIDQVLPDRGAVVGGDVVRDVVHLRVQRLDAAHRHRRLRSAAAPTSPPLFVVAIFLTLVGFAFKISAVPFHFWAPDTYEGAPTPVTAFLSVSSKAGGFVALLTDRVRRVLPERALLAAGPLGARRARR